MSLILGELLILLCLALVSGLFAMGELAIIYARKSRLQKDAEAGSRRAIVALELANDPGSILATVQAGITLLGIFSGVYGGANLAGHLEALLKPLPWLGTYAYPVSYGLVVMVITYITILFGELVPKRLALIHAEAIAKILGPPIQWLSRVLSPMVSFLEWSSALVLRFTPRKLEDGNGVTTEEIKMMIEQGGASGVIDEAEEAMLHKVFRLGARTVAALMTPRTDINWYDLKETPKQNWDRLYQTGYSRFPVGEGSLETVHGIINIEDIARLVIDQRSELDQTVIEEALMVPSNTTALRLLEQLKEQGKHIALVIDEYGGVDGVITLHNLMEAIVGDISEAEDEPDIVLRADGSYLVDAAADIETVLEVLDMTHPHEDEPRDYHSLGGFILGQLGHLPETGESLVFDGHSFEIVDMDRNRIDKVLVTKLAI